MPFCKSYQSTIKMVNHVYLSIDVVVIVTSVGKGGGEVYSALRLYVRSKKVG